MLPKCLLAHRNKHKIRLTKSFPCFFAQTGGASGRGQASRLLIHTSILVAQEETDEQHRVFQAPSSCRTRIVCTVNNWKEGFPGNSGVKKTRRPVQETQVGSLVWEDPTRHGATPPVQHRSRACRPELGPVTTAVHVT